ncbi:hypothetical protein EV356DRAFT_510510 [Viridothelium virens]|uniref:Uncharacterized protein n=1 Tax=Viridothelium virens TaxID=1048519 RepID=A0A6A6HI60_VIRVR|nr:hypothetical protein EV356DRAFT_510510 [Viridothelium virens]
MSTYKDAKPGRPVYCTNSEYCKQLHRPMASSWGFAEKTSPCACYSLPILSLRNESKNEIEGID